MKTFKITNEPSHTLVRFESFANFVAASEQPNPNPKAKDSGHTFDLSNNWTGFATFVEARNLLGSGWIDGATKVRSVSEHVRQAIPESSLLAFAPTQVFDVTGNVLDVGRFLDGEPEYFVDEVTPERGEKIDGNGIVRVTINLSASSGIKASELETRGVYVAALADVLESLGYRVQIDGFFSDEARHLDATGKIKEGGHVIAFPIKVADQPLEIDRLAFVLAHPASLRQIGLHVMDVVGYRDDVYGVPALLPAQYQGDVNVGKLSWESASDADTAKQVLAQLKTLGIDLDLGDLGEEVAA
jgi:hypothetical protein